MSAQGPAPGRIGKRKGAGGVGATNWELSERGSARTRCVLGWGVLTWARPVDSDSAKGSDARRVRWHRVGYRARLGAHRGTSRRRFQKASPERTGRLELAAKALGVAWPPGRAMTKRIVALHYSLCWGAHPASDGHGAVSSPAPSL